MKIFFAAAIAFTVMAAFINAEQERPFLQLHKLEGKWIMKTKRGTIIGEEWIKVDDSYLQNKGFFIKGADTIITERVSLKETKEGIFYTSTVEDQNNKQPIPFKLTSSVDHTFIFENPEHDFPKRIIYQLISSDSLHAYIDAGADKGGKRQNFYFQKQH